MSRHARAPTMHRVIKGVLYFHSYIAARDFAERNNFPSDRINDFQRGWAIQLGVSGPYVGPDTPRPDKPAAAAKESV